MGGAAEWNQRVSGKFPVNLRIERVAGKICGTKELREEAVGCRPPTGLAGEVELGRARDERSAEGKYGKKFIVNGYSELGRI